MGKAGNQAEYSKRPTTDLAVDKSDGFTPFVRVFANDERVHDDVADPTRYTTLDDLSNDLKYTNRSSHAQDRQLLEPLAAHSSLHSPIHLFRPTNTISNSKYDASLSFSADALSQTISLGAPTSTAAVPNSQPIIPFQEMSNSLKLYLRLYVLESTEEIEAWIPGSVIVQKHPFIPAVVPTTIFDFLFGKTSNRNIDLEKGPEFEPCYMMLTSLALYIFKPKFRLVTLNSILQDDQTCYFDPSKLIHLIFKIDLARMLRIDVGPRRQYIAVHAQRSRKGEVSRVKSLVLLTRSKLATTRLVDAITRSAMERDLNFLINQDTEWCIRNIQKNLLLKFGPKSIGVVNYGNTWDVPDLPALILSDYEYDNGINELITKVDFNFVKLYLFVAFMRYYRPVQGLQGRGVEVIHTTLFSTQDFIYLYNERLDVWPPAIFPLGTPTRPNINGPIDEILGFANAGNELTSSKVPLISSILGVGRVSEICRIERWRSWRIDGALAFQGTEFRGIGKALQNGHVGYIGIDSENASHSRQQGTLGGWFWWTRIIFGKAMSGMPAKSPGPTSPPSGIPISTDSYSVSYWWDLCFSSRDTVDEFIDTIRQMRNSGNGVEFVFGDD